jgi:hypothetical protein
VKEVGVMNSLGIRTAEKETIAGACLARSSDDPYGWLRVVLAEMGGRVVGGYGVDNIVTTWGKG